MFHGVHHDAPRDKTRLVMPPAGAIIVMSVLWELFGLVVPAPWLEPFCAFFIVGYLCYDYIHYATHHFPMRHPVAALPQDVSPAAPLRREGTALRGQLAIVGPRVRYLPVAGADSRRG